MKLSFRQPLEYVDRNDSGDDIWQNVAPGGIRKWNVLSEQKISMQYLALEQSWAFFSFMMH